jgi:hypothetical protein
MRFNLINPSDPYTLEADDFEIAAVTVCLLGDGKYPADALGDDANKGYNVPAFLFGGHDEWFQSRFGGTFEAVADRCLKDRTDAVARCFESVTLNSFRRSSLNNIGGRARDMAKAVRSQYLPA